MQSGKKLFAFLLVVCLIVGVIPASVFAAETKTEVIGQQLYLGDDLTMHFHVSVSDTHKADGVMNVVVGNKNMEYSIRDMTANANGNYVFSVDLGAPEMTEDITLTLTSGGEKVLEKVYSIQDYAHYLLENNYTKETKALVKEMLNYGAKAQIYFKHKTDDLANAGYEIESTGSIDTNSPEIVVDGAVDGIDFYGCSLLLESKIAIRYYFTAPNGVKGYTFTVDGNKVDPVYKSNMYYIEIDGVSPDAMDTLKTVKVAKDDAELTVQYSLVYYISRMYNRESTSVEFKDVLLAVKGYFDAAKVFTGTKNILNISTPKTFSDRGALYLNIDILPGVAIYEDLAAYCNEETHVLINDQAWSGAQEIRAFDGKCFYIGKIGAEKGTKITIKEGFSMTSGGATYVTEQECNFWWNGSAWTTQEVKPDQPLVITTPKTFSAANVLYLNMEADHGQALYANMTGMCNEETHILINDQVWNGQELCAFEGKCFYINKIGAVKGTKVTIKAGFTMTVNGTSYVTAQDYNYWWTGSAWSLEEIKPDQTLVITTPKTFSAANTLYLNMEADHGQSLYANMTGICNEESYILINDQVWNGQELCAFEGKCFYINKVGAVKGTKVTIKAGFTMTVNGTNYITAEDYNYWWNGSAWTTEEVKPDQTLVITTPKTFSAANTLYLNMEADHGLSLYANMTGICNEESYILINDQAWNGQELCAFEGKCFYIGKIGGTIGTKVTIKSGFKMTVNGTNYVTAEDYNFWWTGSAWTSTYYDMGVSTPKTFSDRGTLYININLDTVGGTGLSNWNSMAAYANEETHVLINDQAWSGQEICAFEGKCFYIGKIGATLGTKITLKKGFTIALKGAVYVAEQDYSFWWTGSAWTSTYYDMGVSTPKGFSGSGTLYININLDTVSGTGLSNWNNMAAYANEETHVLINDQAWSSQEICAFEGKCFYIGKIGAVVGTKITLKKGFTIALKGAVYVAEQDYNFWWNGSAWTTAEV